MQIQNLQPPPGGRRGGGVCGVVARGMGVANFTFDGFDGDLTDLTEGGPGPAPGFDGKPI